MGSGFKDWSPGDVLTAADVDGYLMRQTVMTFADASARDTALSGVLDEGMMAYLEDTNVTTYYDGSSWEDIRGLGGGSATSPGGFSSGDVLDAADMNGLPAGVLDFQETANDFNLSTTPLDILNLTFTLPSTRTVMLAASVPLYDNFGGTPTNAGNFFQDTNAAGSPTAYYGGAYAILAGATQGQMTTYNVTALAAGTYTIYWVASTNTGTARMNGIAGIDARHQFTAIDLGPV